MIKADLDIDPAIGEACASEFRSYCKVYLNLPDIPSILSGNKKPAFPKDLSARYALTCALAVRAKDVKEVENAFLYIDSKGSMEWLSQCTYEVVTKWKDSDKSAQLVDMITKNKKLLDVADKLQKLLAA